MAEAVPEYPELHRLVDRLTPDQASALHAVALQLVRDDDSAPPQSAPPTPRRRLSFAGIGRGSPDLSATSEEILRSELGTDR